MPSIDNKTGGVRTDSLKRTDAVSSLVGALPHAAVVLCRLGPDLTALVLFTLMWLGIMLAYGAKLHLVEGSILLPTALVAVLTGIAIVTHVRCRFRSSPAPQSKSLARRVAGLLRDWLPLIYLVMVYETLRDYTGTISPEYIDGALLRWDLALFGVEPTVWIQRFFHPLAVEYFQLSYAIYIVPIMFLAAWLSGRGLKTEFREVALATVFCMYAGFLLYILFPAGPPRFYPGLDFDPPTLYGSFGIYDWMNSQMDISKHVIHRASFPSLHVALSTLAVFETWRFANRLWKRTPLVTLVTWVGVSIWVSTIYLRHHWAVDVFAGWALALAAYLAAKHVMIFWSRLEGVVEMLARPTAHAEPSR